MPSGRWEGLAVLLARFVTASTRAQELPKTTPEGAQAAEELFDACVRDGGLQQVGQGRAATWQMDQAKLRATLAAQREQLTPAVRDCLVVGSARAEARWQPVFVALLGAFAREKKDERALGFAAFFRARAAAQSGRVAAEAAYRRAIKHFGVASESVWQALSLNNLGLLLQYRGEYAGAEPLYREALAMFRKLYLTDQYPQGHPVLARSLSNLGELLKDRGDSAGAEPLLREALAMRQQLYPTDKYPQGHKDLALSLHNLGELLRVQGDSAGAEPLYREALAMRQKLYPTDKYPPRAQRPGPKPAQPG
jgi:tetratricopeptide (TPR) repeat protein